MTQEITDYGYGPDNSNFPTIVGFDSRAEAFVAASRFAPKYFARYEAASAYSVRFFVKFAGAREWTALSPHTFFRSETPLAPRESLSRDPYEKFC